MKVVSIDMAPMRHVPQRTESTPLSQTTTVATAQLNQTRSCCCRRTDPTRYQRIEDDHQCSVGRIAVMVTVGVVMLGVFVWLMVKYGNNSVGDGLAD